MKSKQGIKPSKKQLAYIRALYLNHYPPAIIEARTGYKISTIKNYAKEKGWDRELLPRMASLDEILDDFQTIQNLNTAHLLIKASNGEYDEEFFALLREGLNLAKISELYTKQAPLLSVRHSKSILDKIHALIDRQGDYPEDKKVIIHAALYEMQELLVTEAVETLERLA